MSDSLYYETKITIKKNGGRRGAPHLAGCPEGEGKLGTAIPCLE
jgi:hypothetical protein